MATNFPGAVDTYTVKVDNVSDVLAADINNVQDAIVAIQNRIGANASGAVITAIPAQTISGAKTFSGANTFSGVNTFSNVNSFTASRVQIAGGGVAMLELHVPGFASRGWYLDNAGVTRLAQTNGGGVASTVYLTIDGFGNLTAPGKITSSTASRDGNDWNNRQMLVEGGSMPAIGFHASASTSAGIFRYVGATGRFEFRNSADSGFVGTQASEFRLATGGFAPAAPDLGWVTLAGQIFTNALPAGGTWAWWWGSPGGTTSGINAGGYTLPNIGIYDNGFGFAWRIR